MNDVDSLAGDIRQFRQLVALQERVALAVDGLERYLLSRHTQRDTL